MNIQPYYVAIADFDDLGIGHACDPESFSGACDAYADKMSEGIECMVFRVEPPKGASAWAMTDVTDDAAREVARWHNRRGDDFPAWLADQAAEDAR